MQSYSFLCKPIYWFVWLVFFMLSLFIEPCYTAPSRPPPPVVPPPPAQDYLDKYRRGGPHATTDSPDGQNAIVYNSPHSSLKFYPSAGRLVLHQNHRCFNFFLIFVGTPSILVMHLCGIWIYCTCHVYRRYYMGCHFILKVSNKLHKLNNCEITNVLFIPQALWIMYFFINCKIKSSHQKYVMGFGFVLWTKQCMV